MSNNNAGAVVHRSRIAEDRRDAEIDARNAGKCWHFMDAPESMDVQTLDDFVAFCREAGITVRSVTHPKSRRRWKDDAPD